MIADFLPSPNGLSGSLNVRTLHYSTQSLPEPKPGLTDSTVQCNLILGFSFGF